jgi:hypothetical protein
LEWLHRHTPNAISSYAVSNTLFYQNNKSKVTFLKCADFFLAVIKAQQDESGGKILLGDNTSGGAVMLG